MLLFISAVAVLTSSVSGTGCTLNVKNQLLPKKEPLILEIKDKGKLEIARLQVEGNGRNARGVIYVQEDEELVIACIGNNNVNPVTRQQTAFAKCTKGILTIEGNAVDSDTLSCSAEAAKSSVNDVRDQCGEDEKGVTFELGFKKRQDEIFDQILGRVLNVYLVKGHLAPDGDFVYHTGQRSTYYYINVAPQWSTFNNGNWKIIENTVRTLAKQEQATLSVWTGVYGVLKLEGSNREEKKMYLNPVVEGGRVSSSKSTVPVPQVFWKLVYHRDRRLCIVAVGHNNVFLKTNPTPICDTVNVNRNCTEQLKRLEKGYSYFCDYENFKRNVSYIPHINCKGIFQIQNANC